MSKRLSGNYCGKYKIICLGPTRLLKTNISSHSCFHMDKSIWHLFRRIIECDIPEETIYTSSETLLTITVEDIRSILLDLIGC